MVKNFGIKQIKLKFLERKHLKLNEGQSSQCMVFEFSGFSTKFLCGFHYRKFIAADLLKMFDHKHFVRDQ